MVDCTDLGWLIICPNQAVDVAYGLILCLCSLTGTVGNIVSFLYFKSKERNISSTIYMMITTNDTVISFVILPVGIALLSDRQPGALFGNVHSCGAFAFIWEVAVFHSIFLVICLSTSRTLSLIRPFLQQKKIYLIVAVVTYLVIMSAGSAVSYWRGWITTSYSSGTAACVVILQLHKSASVMFIWIITYFVGNSVPLLVVATSCIVTALKLKRTNESVGQAELYQARRNRATVTILLFALVYGVCNIALVVDINVKIYCFVMMLRRGFFKDVFEFSEEYYYYYFISIHVLLIAVNSAVNPVLYFWRMPALRSSIVSQIRSMILKFNRVMGRSQNEVNLVEEDNTYTMVITSNRADLDNQSAAETHA